jgi:outer membrane biosynthesis protein TonB
LQAIPKRFCLFTTGPLKKKKKRKKKKNKKKTREKKKNRKKETRRRRRRRRRPGISSGSGRRRIRRRAAAGGGELRCCFGYSFLFTIRQKNEKKKHPAAVEEQDRATDKEIEVCMSTKHGRR